MIAFRRKAWYTNLISKVPYVVVRFLSLFYLILLRNLIFYPLTGCNEIESKLEMSLLVSNEAYMDGVKKRLPTIGYEITAINNKL